MLGVSAPLREETAVAESAAPGPPPGSPLRTAPLVPGASQVRYQLSVCRRCLAAVLVIQAETPEDVTRALNVTFRVAQSPRRTLRSCPPLSQPAVHGGLSLPGTPLHSAWPL